jgi:hypothetical protein
VAFLFEPVAFAADVDHRGAVQQPICVSGQLIPVPEDCIAELVYPVLTCPMKFELSALFPVFPLANFFPFKRSRVSALPRAFKAIRRGRALTPARSMTWTAKSCIYRFCARSAGADARPRPNSRLSHLESAAFLARTSVGVTPLESVFTQTTRGWGYTNSSATPFSPNRAPVYLPRGTRPGKTGSAISRLSLRKPNGSRRHRSVRATETQVCSFSAGSVKDVYCKKRLSSAR